MFFLSRFIKDPSSVSKHIRDVDVCATRWLSLVGLRAPSWRHTWMHLGSFHIWRGLVHLSRTVFCLLLTLLMACLALGDFCQEQLNHWQFKHSPSTWSYFEACSWHGIAEFPLIIISSSISYDSFSQCYLYSNMHSCIHLQYIKEGQ